MAVVIEALVIVLISIAVSYRIHGYPAHRAALTRRLRARRDRAHNARLAAELDRYQPRHARPASARFTYAAEMI